jgi:hypothetical protein
MTSAPFRDRAEFNYAKPTHVVIDVFGLQDARKSRQISSSASIDATKVTKNTILKNEQCC